MHPLHEEVTNGQRRYTRHNLDIYRTCFKHLDYVPLLDICIENNNYLAGQ